MTAWLDTPNYVSRSAMPPDDVAALSRLEFARNGDLLATDVVGEAPIGSVSYVGPSLWMPSAAPAIGDLVQPTAGNATGRFYRAIAVGPGATTSATEPAWPSTIGATVVDGAVTWACVASLLSVLLTASAMVASSPTDFATVSVYKRTLGGAAVLVAQGTTSPTGAGLIGALPAKISVAVPPVSPAVAVAYGDALSVAFTKSGAGVILPPLTIAAVLAPSFVDVQLEQWCSWIRDRLRARYDTVAIDANPPNTCKRWLEALVTRECYVRRGTNTSSDKGWDGELFARADRALAEIKEAADSKDGLIELPMRDAFAATAVSKSGPLSYTEQSPFVSADRQEREGLCEDARGIGSYGGFGR